MKNHLKFPRFFCCCLALLLCLTALTGCSGKSAAKEIPESPYDLTEPKVGVITGSVFDQLAEETWEGAQLFYFNTIVDAIPSLTSGKIDCILADNGPISLYDKQYPEVVALEEHLTTEPYGFIFQKNEKGAALRDEFNEVLSKWKEDNTLEAMIECWMSGDESSYPVLDFSSLPAVKGTLKVNYYGQDPPLDFVMNDLPAGLCLELFYRFCEEAGYAAQVDMVQGDSMIAGVVSGKYDVSCSDWTITEERAESVNFSDVFYTGGAAVLVASGESSDTGFFEGLQQSFIKTFVKENRWLDFLSGIGVTLIVTGLSLLLGTLFGFGIYLCSRKKAKIVVPVMNFFSWLIRGMPEVLLLLILFYIVFGKMDINGMWVAVTAFTLIVCIEVYGTIGSSVSAIDKGQTEGALALGYTPNQAFFRIIFPQALTYIMPSYYSMVVSLIKSTAIVGYVAVRDLTKVSDIVRSRTFEAFFPLIATAIIYYILAWILLKIVRLIQKHLMPIRHNPSDILKGIRTEEEQ